MVSIDTILFRKYILLRPHLNFIHSTHVHSQTLPKQSFYKWSSLTEQENRGNYHKNIFLHVFLQKYQFLGHFLGVKLIFSQSLSTYLLTCNFYLKKD